MAGRRMKQRKIIVHYSDEFTRAQICLKVIKLLIDERERGACSNDCAGQGKM